MGFAAGCEYLANIVLCSEMVDCEGVLHALDQLIEIDASVFIGVEVVEFDEVL